MPKPARCQRCGHDAAQHGGLGCSATTYTWREVTLEDEPGHTVFEDLTVCECPYWRPADV